MRTVLTTLVAVLCSIPATAMPEDSKSKTIQTPSGPVTTTTKTVDPTPQKIVLLDSKEVLVIEELAFKSKHFVAHYLPGRTNPSLSDFDEAFGLWQQEEKRRY